ncbi:MAG: peptidoglycan-binding protein [Verrucomicrobiota bacterium]|nr:peptidoglycan-binding protein [Verrucomicrobiota bacterium]
MKTSFAIVAVAALGFGAGNLSAKDNGNTSSNSGVPAPHRGSAAAPTTTVAPHFSGAPHYSGGMPYRPAISYRNGSRTFNYPPVGVSTLRHPMHSGASNFSGAYALQRSGNSRHLSGLNTTGGKATLDPQTSSRLRNWSGNVSSVSQARLNQINQFHHHHGSNWWRNRCAAFIFFDWGWWGWYDGWWYPAWGYDPYSYYEYNEPIYGYDGLSPDQIVASVQVALQQRGYYTWAVDGKMGPLTRAAIARYQRDHLLPITSGIDPATLGSLGIIS